MIKILSQFSLISILFLVTSCGSGSTGTLPDTEDGEIALALLPLVGASQSVVNNTTTVSTNINNLKFTIGTYNASLPATPALCAGRSGDCSDAGNSVTRFPSSGYLQDFYSESGNQAYMELRSTSDNWGDYQVSLFLYPSLSTSVKYSTEIYRVNADSWDNLIDQNGQASPVAFEEQKTYYFDSRVETRTTTWSRYVDSLSYPLFSVPSSFDSNDFDYDSFSEPTKATPSDQGGAEDFSSSTTFSISYPNLDCDSDNAYYCITESGTEYYTQIPNSNGVNALVSKARTQRKVTYLKGQLKDFSITMNTVRYDQTDVNGDKTVKAKTVQTYTLNNRSSSTTTQETIQISDPDDDNATNYTSTVAITSETSFNERVFTYNYTYTMELEETGENTNEYTGTYTITYTYANNQQRAYTYNVTLNKDGIRYSYNRNNSSLVKLATSSEEQTLDLGDLNNFSDDSAYQTVSFTLDSNTINNTQYMGGMFLNGTLSNQDIIIGEGFMIFQDQSE